MNNKIIATAIIAFLVCTGIAYFVISPSDTEAPAPSLQSLADNPQLPMPVINAYYDSIPGQSAYTPLRNPYIVNWNENTTPRILKSVDEVLAAEESGELTVTQSDVIVNAPVVRW